MRANRFVILLLLMFGIRLSALTQPGPFEYQLAEKEPEILNYAAISAMIPYPAEAWKQSMTGAVYFRVLLDGAGRYVRHIRLSDRLELLTAAAEPFLPMLVCTPAKNNGHPLSHYWINVHFTFDQQTPRRKVATYSLDQSAVNQFANRRQAGQAFDMGVNHLAEENYSAASTWLGWSLLLRPAHLKRSKNQEQLADAYFRHGVSLSREGKGQQAMVSFNHCLNLIAANDQKGPSQAQVWVERALARIHEGASAAEAAMDLEAAANVGLSPEQFAAWARLPYTTIQPEQFREVRYLLQGAQAIDVAQFMQISLYITAGQIPEAEQLLWISNHNHPLMAPTLALVVKAKLQQGDFAHALGLLDAYPDLAASDALRGEVVAALVTQSEK